MGVRPYVRYFDSSKYVTDLATGEICVAVGWVNGVHQARMRGAQAATPVEVAYAIPKEGAAMYFDFMAIPVDAANPDKAHAFLNYLMEPKVIAAVTDVVGQPSGNAAALPFVDEAIRGDPTCIPRRTSCSDCMPMRLFRGLHSTSESRLDADPNRAVSESKKSG